MTLHPLTPEERAAIQAFEAAGRVKVCPPRTFTDLPPVPLREVIRRQSNAGKAKTAENNAKFAAEAAKRRALAAPLLAEGMSFAEVGRRIGIGPDTVAKYAERIREEAGC